MTTALAERPTTVATTTAPASERPAAAQDEVDRDGIEVYCPDAEAWSPTRHFFCETCGATDHELR